MSRVNLSVLIDDRYRDRILEVVEVLQANGMKVEHSMEQIGVITGSIDSTQVERISNIEGVASVEFAQGYQLEPPESDIQ
ncbi:MAG: ketohydroxyglutarate aldolase [Cyanomargarita calcarea GSE-NOS-MK-12-04C]|jgi:uncharacterized protein involved in propanediol utilization|uniref:Ketohydroxyglutarate aldolase n=1 Tax=Cyanomargarita calcarea GSE-NOS-MK-12-04C TaxID=2839659 RepID=A0A951QRV5_9CYAN|nr:ketohydroxyglutarate aldolase [Cyanomargarita calcarea GSE-NOS-MK-12-04C]